MTQPLSEVHNQEALKFDDKADPAVRVGPKEMIPEAGPPDGQSGRPGFLPIRTNTWDRIFISVICYVAIHLLWMRFIEAFIPLFVATILSLVLAVVIIRRG